MTVQDKTSKHELGPEEVDAIRAIVVDVVSALVVDAKDPNTVDNDNPIMNPDADGETELAKDGEAPVDAPPVAAPEAPLAVAAPLPEDEKGYAIPAVEIFRVGEWNGEEYERADLEDMILAFGGVGYDVPLKIGHAEDDTAPASGWVTNLRMEGDRLVADFEHMPKQVYDMVRGRRYNAVSSEIFFNLKRGDRSFRRALKAVALLGAATPGVAGLRPLHQAVFAAGDYGKLVTLTFSGGKDMADKKVPADIQNTAGDALDVKRLTEELAEMRAKLAASDKRTRTAEVEAKVEKVKIPALRDHFRAIYSLVAEDTAPKVVKFTVDGQEKATDVHPERVIDDLVARLNEKVATLFTEIGAGRVDRSIGVDYGADMPAGEAIDAKVKAHMAKTGKAYGAAWAEVMKAPENKELSARYREEVR